jgi:glycosyltransferase involved in cell wall biosynthesis
MKPLKICMVAPQAFPVLADDRTSRFIGGAELQQTIVAKELARRGHHVSMVCMDHGQAPGSIVQGVSVLNAYRPHAGVPVLRFLWPRLTSVWRCLTAAGADVYYARTAVMLAGVIAAFSRMHDRKSVFAGAGNPDFEKNTRRVPSRHHRWLYEYGLRNVDRIVVQNEEQRDLCARNYGRDSVLIPSCYPDPGLQQSPSGEYILWVSTIRSLKRPDLALKLARALPNRQFKMIGGPEPTEQSLFERIKHEASEIRNLEFLGFVPYAEIDEYFDRAEVVINTSESEGFPNTFLQAWSRGVPTVSFIDSGARLDYERVGIGVDSIDQMIEAIRSLTANKERLRAEGLRSRRYYELVHKPENVIDKYEAFFTELLSSDANCSARVP